MKTAFVLGFYNPVESALHGSFGREFESGNLIWVGRESGKFPFDLTVFSSRLAQVSRISDSVLVLLADFRGYEWVKRQVDAILHSICGGGARLVLFRNAQDAEAVIIELQDFGLAATIEEVTEATLLRYLGDSRILCVRAQFQASFPDGFRRAGIWFPRCEDRFEERLIAPGQNSNLIRTLDEAADRFDFLLYAWTGLRTISADVKRKYKRAALEADTTAKVVALFKKNLI